MFPSFEFFLRIKDKRCSCRLGSRMVVLEDFGPTLNIHSLSTYSNYSCFIRPFSWKEISHTLICVGHRDVLKKGIILRRWMAAGVDGN